MLPRRCGGSSHSCSGPARSVPSTPTCGRNPSWSFEGTRAPLESGGRRCAFLRTSLHGRESSRSVSKRSPSSRAISRGRAPKPPRCRRAPRYRHSPALTRSRSRTPTCPAWRDGSPRSSWPWRSWGPRSARPDRVGTASPKSGSSGRSPSMESARSARVKRDRTWWHVRKSSPGQARPAP